MSKARQNRLRKAKEWFPEQGFTEDSHIVKMNLLMLMGAATQRKCAGGIVRAS